MHVIVEMGHTRGCPNAVAPAVEQWELNAVRQEHTLAGKTFTLTVNSDNFRVGGTGINEGWLHSGELTQCIRHGTPSMGTLLEILVWIERVANHVAA